MTEVTKTDATFIKSRLENLTKTAEDIRAKTQEITIATAEITKDSEAAGEIKPNTFAVEIKGTVKRIDIILQDALAALRAFI